jgi:integrase
VGAGRRADSAQSRAAPSRLRHTAVALWNLNGASPLQVKQLAGHERSTLTLDRYGHLCADAHDDVMAALDARMSGRAQLT